MRTSIMVDLTIVHFRNPYNNSFLEQYHFHSFMAFCAHRSSISLDMCIE